MLSQRSHPSVVINSLKHTGTHHSFLVSFRNKAETKKPIIRRIKETISEKLIRLYSEFNLEMLGPIHWKINYRYNQNALISKINLSLAERGKGQLKQEGYCHGIGLLWLAMISWGIENLF